MNSLVLLEKYPSKEEWFQSKIVYNDLVAIFETANKRLIKKDIGLFKEKVSERTICGSLMMRLKSVLWGTPFRAYNIDVEYNRNKDGTVKTVIDNQMVVTNITCDLIVHSRGSCIIQDNLIALEMKKAERLNAEKKKDKQRRIALTREGNQVWCYDGKTFPKHVCRYILGIYYEISRNYDRVYLEYYRQGALVAAKTIDI